MSVEIWVAALSGTVAIGSAILSARTAARTARIQHDLGLKRDEATKERQVQEFMSRYREPLARAAFDLQGRIYNIVGAEFLKRHLGATDEDDHRYARTSTLFLVAQYFGWVEIVRRGVQFLDLGDTQQSHELVENLDRVSHTLSNTDWFPASAFRCYRVEQRALGELMIERIPEDPRGYQCIGYVRFTERLEAEPGFSRWFVRMEREITLMTDPPPGMLDRLIRLQRELVDLVNCLDPLGIRFPRAHREKLPESDAPR